MQTRWIWASLVLILASLMMGGCCPHNPTPNTAISAHGNTDWHIDTAQEFLTGRNMSGALTAANHCPDTWSREHMHVGLSSTDEYYHDKDLILGGLDADPNEGIDRAMLFFYAGHGDPEGWDALGSAATQEHMSLGDCPGGRLRYYWQCSCEVFAHGPQTRPNQTWDYSRPSDFDGSADCDTMRNVYERWGPVLSKDLRMACGMSTSAYCHEGQVNRVWSRYNNGSMVADAFIDGFAVSDVVPLCITLGGLSVASTPLYDSAFTSAANGAGASFYHIQYPEGFALTSVGPTLIEPIPELLRRVEVIPQPWPDPPEDHPYKLKDGMLLGHDEIEGRGPRLRIDPASGATYVVGEIGAAVEEPRYDERGYIDHAREFLSKQDWTERDVAEPVAKRFMIARGPVERGRGTEERLLKSVVVTFRRQIDVDGTPVNVLGPGGEMRVQLNPDGSVLNASKVWREIESLKDAAPVKRFEEAYEEALRKLENPEAYELREWNWGYVEEAGNVEQKELELMFQFMFAPTDEREAREYPPRIVMIPGFI